jgi:hypothetical protein
MQQSKIMENIPSVLARSIHVIEVLGFHSYFCIYSLVMTPGWASLSMCLISWMSLSVCSEVGEGQAYRNTGKPSRHNAVPSHKNRNKIS